MSDKKEYVNKDDLILWLKGEKYGYLLDDKKTWVNYGDSNDKFPYNEEDRQWELSRNMFIDKIIRLLEYEDVSSLVSDYKEDNYNL